MSHQRPHDIIEKDGYCAICERILVYVEDTVHFNPFWRHKPTGYKWGDRVKYLEAEVRRLKELLRTQNDMQKMPEESTGD
jgi:hypothetical protein